MMIAGPTADSGLELYDTGSGISLYVSGTSLGSLYSGNTADGNWHHLSFIRAGSAVNLYLDGVVGTQRTAAGTVKVQYFGCRNASSTFNWAGSVSDLRITHAGITTYWPLQEGGTTRDVYYLKSDGTYGVSVAAIKNGTIETIRGTQTNGAGEAWDVKYGGKMDAGVFIPGAIGVDFNADGSAKVIAPGRFGNTNSVIDFNPDGIADGVTLWLENDYQYGDARVAVGANGNFKTSSASGEYGFYSVSDAL
jgi:hypothetical protein